MQFQVDDMTCGHCAGRITDALKQIDRAAVIAIDLSKKQVEVQSSAPSAALSEAISGAGYTPVALG